VETLYDTLAGHSGNPVTVWTNHENLKSCYGKLVKVANDHIIVDDGTTLVIPFGSIIAIRLEF
jgi:hypothetical protein